jgi:anti-sigma regulatory factor (Ser/Thr protein kinase)
MTISDIAAPRRAAATSPPLVAAARPARPRSQADNVVSLRAWPLRSHMVVPARPEAVRPTRQEARTTVCRWHLETLADTVELLVSELVTNAVNAAATMPARPARAPEFQVRFWLASDRHQVMIHVWDPDRRRPVSQDAWPDAETGRGLMLVTALSTRWGCYSPEGQGGKIVWALCAP